MNVVKSNWCASVLILPFRYCWTQLASLFLKHIFTWLQWCSTTPPVFLLIPSQFLGICSSTSSMLEFSQKILPFLFLFSPANSILCPSELSLSDSCQLPLHVKLFPEAFPICVEFFFSSSLHGSEFTFSYMDIWYVMT